MYTADLLHTRTEEERQACEERAQSNLELMARIYGKKEPTDRPKAVHGPLHRAIIAGDLSSVRAELNPETVNQATISGLTPLHLAMFGYGQIAERGPWRAARLEGRKLPQEIIVDLILEAGARLDVWDHAHRLPAACCEGKRLPDSFKSAMEQKIKSSTEEPTPTGVHFNAFFCVHDAGGDALSGRK